MLTIVLMFVVFILLATGGAFALMAKDNLRRGQSGSHGTASGAKQGRAPGLD